MADFHQITELHFNCPLPDAESNRLFRDYLTKKRDIKLLWDLPDALGQAVFQAPDYQINLADGNIVCLGIPDIPNLTDFHLHTELAFCSENMRVPEALQMAALSGVKLLNFSEHSAQLFAPAAPYWQNQFVWAQRQEADNRFAAYEALIARDGNAACRFGLELEHDAELYVVDQPSRYLNGFRLGAIHFLSPNLSYAEQKLDYLRRLDALLEHGVDILAHPFRVFRRNKLPIPQDLFEPVAEKLVRSHTAAEINFHTNRPPAEFIQLVVKKGGKISFGSDSHNLYEVGFFKMHYDFCRSLDLAGRLDELLLSAATDRPKAHDFSA